MIWNRPPRSDRTASEVVAPPSIAKAIETLPADLRAIVLMRRSEGISTADIATRLGLDEHQTLRLLARAMALITMELGIQERAWHQHLKRKPPQ